MNKLSLMLYISDVLPNIATLFAATAGFIVGIVAIWYLVVGLYNIEAYADRKAKYPKQFLVYGSIIAFFFVMIACFIPTSKTILLIAGSEAAQAVVMSNDGQDILNDVKVLIKRQINDLGAEKAKKEN